jgi:hypothetical protein
MTITYPGTGTGTGTRGRQTIEELDYYQMAEELVQDHRKQ